MRVPFRCLTILFAWCTIVLAIPLPAWSEPKHVDWVAPGADQIQDPALKAEYKKSYLSYRAYAEIQKMKCVSRNNMKAVSGLPFLLYFIDGDYLVHYHHLLLLLLPEHHQLTSLGGHSINLQRVRGLSHPKDCPPGERDPS